MSTFANDADRREFLIALDNAPFEVTDWEAGFIEGCMGRRGYSPKQREMIEGLARRYGHRVKPKARAQDGPYCRGCGMLASQCDCWDPVNGINR